MMASGKSYAAEVQRPRVLFIFAIWACVPVLFTSELAWMVQPGLGLLGTVVSLALLAVLVLSMQRFPTREHGMVTVRDDVLVMRGRPVLQRRNIRGVCPVSTSDRAVVIEQRGIRRLRTTTIVLKSPSDLAAIIDDLRWDESQAVQEFTLVPHPKRRFPLRLFVALTLVEVGLALGPSIGHLNQTPFHALQLVAALIWFGALLRSFFRDLFTKIRVGTDGVLVQSSEKTRFVAYQDMRAVTQSDYDVTFQLISGEALCCSHGRPDVIGDELRKLNPVSPTAALFKRIENARALFLDRAEIRSQLLAALRRDGRSVQEWHHAVSAVSQTHYRVAATPRDVLEKIVKDAAVAPDVRIGAALALHADPGARIHVATETSALPELGQAIDAALDGDDPALERAMATLKLDV